MLSQLILGVMYILTFFLYMVVLWRVSIWQKLKRNNFATSFLITAITTVVTLTVMVPYLIGLSSPLVIRILISIFTFVLTIFLIKTFYKTRWWKALKIYLWVILFAFLITTAIFLLIFTIGNIVAQIFKYF